MLLEECLRTVIVALPETYRHYTSLRRWRQRGGRRDQRRGLEEL